MATRLYIANNSPSFTPTTKRGSWDNSAATLVRDLGSKSGATATAAVAEASGTSNYDVLLGRWVSLPLTAAYTFTTSDTVEWILGVLESSTSANDKFHIHIFVTQGDTDALRGTLLSNNIGGTEWPTTAAGLGAGTKALGAVSASAGDHIVIEVGYQAQNTSTSSFTGTVYYGNTGSTDLTSGSTNVTTEPGWFEFSPTLSFSYSISVSDTITIDEEINGAKYIIVSDSITVSERNHWFVDRGRLFMTGFELNNTSAGVEIYNYQGSPTIVTTTVRTGTYALRSNGGDIESLEIKVFDPEATASGDIKHIKTYYRAYVYIGTALNANSGILYLGNRFGQQTAIVRLNTDNTLTLVKRTVVVGSASSTIPTGEWHMVELSCQVKASTIDIEARLDGVVFATQTGSTSEVNPFSYFRVGVQGGATAGDIYFDDVAVNTDAGGYPGPGNVARLLPDSAGDSNQWRHKSGSSGDSTNYQEVDEAGAPDDSTTYIKHNEVDIIDDYNVASIPGATSSTTINWVGIGVRYGNTTVNDLDSAFVTRLKREVDGTVDESGVQLASGDTGWKTISEFPYSKTPFYNMSIITNVDPEGETWTKAYTDSMQIGARISIASSTTDNIRITSLWAYVDYYDHIQDTITVTESVSLSVTGGISVSDTVTVTESVAVQSILNISVSDTITVTESVSVSSLIADALVSVLDSVTVTESVSLLLISNISVSDTVTVTESVSNTGQASISVSDSITVTDVVALTNVYDISVVDSVAVTESVSVTNVYDVSVSDSITVTESVSFLVQCFISVSDTVMITESVVAEKVLAFSVSDTVTITESVTLSESTSVSVNDVITVTEDMNLVMSGFGFFGVSVNDTVTVTDALAYVETAPRALKHVYIAGATTALISADSPPLFNLLQAGYGGTSWVIAEARRAGVVTSPGYIDNLHIKLAVAPGASKGRSFAVVKNGSATSLSVTITGTDTQGTNTTTRIAVSAGDTLSLQETHTSSPAASHAAWSLDFSGDTPKEYAYYSASSTALPITGTVYVDPFVGGTWNGTYGNQSVVIPHTGTIKSLYIKLSVAPGGSTARRFSLYINGVEDTSTRVTITGAATTGNITGLSVSLSAADTIALGETAIPDGGGGNPAAATAGWGVGIQSAAEGESMIASRSATALSTGSAEYNMVADNDDAYSGTEGTFHSTNTTTALFLKNFRVVLSAAPGSGKSRVFRFRKDTGNGNEVVTISDLVTSGVDTTNIDSLTAAFSDLAISHTPSGTPTAATAQWSFTLVVPAAISVSDSITVSESVSVSRGYSVSVSDSVTVSENLQFEVNSKISVSDTITVTDVVNVAKVYDISVSDSITITESIQTSVTSRISVSDAITVTDVPTVAQVHFISVVDSITVTESVATTLVFGVSVSDTVTVSESVTLQVVSFVSVRDSITVSESVNLTQVYGLSVNDAVTVTEAVSLTQVYTLLVFDTVTVSESISTSVTSRISVSDTVTVSEAVVVSPVSFISVNDAISVTESVQVAQSIPFSVFETITVTDVVSTPVVSTNISVFEAIAVTESISFEVNSKISVSDSITVTDVPSVRTIFDIVVSETITVSESVSVTVFIGNLSVVETITVTDIVIIIGSFGINVNETITVTESLSVGKFFPLSVYDTVTVTDFLDTVSLIVIWRGRSSISGGGSIWTDVDRPIPNWP